MAKHDLDIYYILLSKKKNKIKCPGQSKPPKSAPQSYVNPSPLKHKHKQQYEAQKTKHKTEEQVNNSNSTLQRPDHQNI